LNGCLLVFVFVFVFVFVLCLKKYLLYMFCLYFRNEL
jgi:hypothetical protein